MSALAATTPSLGAAASYAILSSTYTNTSAGTTVNGDIGFTTGPFTTPQGSHPNYGSGDPYSQAGTDQGTALTDLNSQPCTFTFDPGPIDLATDTTHGPIGVYTPGVYCTSGAGAAEIGTAGITLSGAGTYIFRINGAFTTVDTSTSVTLDGASVCDVFWTPTEATTLGATTTFQGTIIDDAGITVGANTNWTGKALAFGGTVTTGDTSTITASCVPPAPPSSGPGSGNLTVVKQVINDSGGTKSVSDFQLLVNGTTVVSGNTYSFPAPGTLTVTETGGAGYTQTFSGDCSPNGQVSIEPNDIKTCVVTNDDIGPAIVVPPVPPLIDVVKVPSPLALPAGPGPVTYTYTLRNIGTVTVTDLTMVGDTCSPVTLVSGDTNSNGQLEVSETWVYRCTTTLNETHTNTIVATGMANGLTASDIARATVVVGAPIVPPLIHVTKVPNPIALGVGGGMVTYTEQITNPGEVALSNVTLTDDKCSPMSYISGDTNNDGLLDVSETWTYTCRTNVTRTTTNVATATGQANGLTVTDVAIATVTVATAAPALPQAGAPSSKGMITTGLVGAALAAFAMLLFALRYTPRRNEK